MTLDVYLSPHFDDAVLSCGGSIARASDEGDGSHVVTVFGGRMPDGFVPDSLVRRLHAASGTVDDLVAERQHEDAAAIRVLGATGEVLQYPEAAYRWLPNGRSAGPADLRRNLNEDDRALAAAIVADLVEALPGELTLHGPLAVGGHVDHRIVRSVAGEMARQRGLDVLLYEDLPYAARAGNREIAAASAGLTPIMHLLSDEQLDRKIAAVAAYASQVRMMWRSRSAMDRELRWYARSLTPKGPAEREWAVDA